MALTERELTKRGEFDKAYRQGRQPELQAIERQVCGCDYGATSWATSVEADLIADLLALQRGVSLLEIGAGSGWPALYLADKSYCDLVLTDLPLDGLRIAAARAVDDRLPGICLAAAADAAQLPFADHTFDVVNHSDVLCCLIQKQEVLAECRRIVRPHGRMVFSTIYMPVGLTAKEHALAVEGAPEFVDTEIAYPALLDATDWQIAEQHDLSEEFARTCAARLRAEHRQHDALLPLLGADELERRRAQFSRRIVALESGVLKRELFLVTPAQARLRPMPLTGGSLR